MYSRLPRLVADCLILILCVRESALPCLLEAVLRGSKVNQVLHFGYLSLESDGERHKYALIAKEYFGRYI